MRSFLKAGVMTETGGLQPTMTGTPQGGIASPLFANIALSARNRQYMADWAQMSSWHGKRRVLHKHGHPTYSPARQGDRAAGTVTARPAEAASAGTRTEAESEKTAVTHIDEGFVFLGHRIIRRA
ncbi:MAG: hypothetical protein ABSH51_26240 [Solirubrobacteraceae bacterium]